MDKVLIVLVIILGVIAVAQLTRVYELTRKLSGKREEDVSTKDNRLNGGLMILFMLLFYGFLIWLMIDYGQEVLIHHPASKHGAWIDNLMIFNFVIILFVFFLTQTLLFWFSYKYFGKEGRQALFYPHNDRLELLWTIVPSIFLAVIIIYGLTTWNRIMDKPSEDALQVGVYGKQFDWTVRYPGEDGELGPTNYLLISTANPLGIITKENIAKKLSEKEDKIDNKDSVLQARKEIMPDWKKEKIQDEIAKLKRDTGRIRNISQQDLDLKAGYDDKVVTDTLYLPKDREVNFHIRSRDVIHSAYMPHFRAQMNAVPGMETSFKFTPTITTDSMRTIKEDPDFDYMLICNKICGTSHYNMKMGMKVGEQAEFREWLKGKETFAKAAGLKKAGMAEKKKN
jgi:cytochrome c oxidase subunit 2